MKDLRKIPGCKFMKHRRWELRKSMTGAEEILWERLRKKRFLGLRFRRQHGIGPYVADFYHSKSMTVIEVDGYIHYRKDVMDHDIFRQEYLEGKGYTILRFSNSSVLNNIQSVLLKIKSQINCSHPPG
jgi:very-short-patch-repair endonuclease